MKLRYCHPFVEIVEGLLERAREYEQNGMIEEIVLTTREELALFASWIRLNTYLEYVPGTEYEYKGIKVNVDEVE